MKYKDVKKVVIKTTDERPSFCHGAYEYIPQIDSKDFLLNDMHTHIFSEWFDNDESEVEE